jgi:ELWxxDGT repeat protein
MGPPRHILPLAHALEPRRLLAASPVELVKDIDPRTFSSLALSEHELVTIGPIAYFNPGTTGTPDGERELWRTDGTDAGTWMVKDIVPGDRGSSPQNLTPVGNTLFFKAPAPGVAPDVYRVLWKSDGTDAGTVPVRDAAGQPIVTDRVLTALDDRRVVFVSGFSMNERQLWVSDGTPAGTRRLLADLSEAWFGPGEYAAAIGQFYFVNAGSLWSTDGTEAGTRLVKDVRPGPGVDIHDLTAAGNQCFFAGNDGTSGYDLWLSNGSAAGTRKVRDLPNDPNNGADPGPTPMTWTGNALYFMLQPGAAELWKSNGTAAGTVKVKDLALNRIPGGYPLRLGSAGLRAYFADLGPGNQWKLWTTDGTAAGSHVVDNAAGDLTLPDGFNYAMNDVGGRLFFNGVTPSTGEELWSTDGTTAGTRIVRDAIPGPESGGPRYARAASDRLYFAPYDALVGSEPWVADATGTSAHLAADVNRQAYWSQPQFLRRTGGRVNFFAWNASESGLWRTDGTTAGTSFVAPLQPGGNFNAPHTFGSETTAALGDLFIFSGYPYGTSGPPRLYRSDGTSAGTFAIGGGFTTPYRLTTVGDKVFFVADSTGPAPKQGVYVTDGTDAGTRLLAQQPAVTTPDVWSFVDVGGVAYFLGTSAGANGPDLWRSDGTPQGTRPLGYAPFGPQDYTLLLGRAGDGLVFVADHGGNLTLYRSDGTAAGTAPVTTFPESIYNAPRYLPVSIGPLMYFNGPDGLWRTDGTAGGTFLLKQGAAFYNQTHDHKYTGVLGGRFFFSLPAPGGTVELWSTDGTVAGTTRAAAFGNNPAMPQDFAAAGNLLYFVVGANDAQGNTRYSLWGTDGTEQGTFPVPWDVPFANSPHDLEELNGDLLLGALDLSTVGDELWKIPGPPPPPFVVGRNVFYNNSRFDGRDPSPNANDDRAIAIDKQALLPGGAPSFANVTGYSRGINGVMIDLWTRFAFYDDVRLSFRVGRGGERGTWTAAPAPLSVTRGNNHVPLDVDRLTVIWADGAFRNKWLEVTVEGLAGGRVVATDVFCYGNLVGETGDVPAVQRVTAADVTRTRAALFTRAAAIDNPFDHNRDGFVNALDLNIVRGNLFASIEPPASPVRRQKVLDLLT